MERFFRDLNFGEDFSRSVAFTRLRKWTVPLNVTVTGDVVPDDRKTIEAQLDLVASLTELPWRFVDGPGANANLTFVFTPEQGPRFLGEHVPCFAGTNAPQGVVTESEIVISTADRERAKPCVTHELMHAIGFPKHSGVLPSVSSPFSRELEFTEWDRIAIKVLYDKRLRPGMTEAQAAPIYRKIIRELM